MTTTTCEALRRSLDAGDLDPHTAAWRDHVATCPACREHAALTEACVAELRDALEARARSGEHAGEDAGAAVLHDAFRRKRNRTVGLAAAAVLALGVVGAGFALERPRERTDLERAADHGRMAQARAMFEMVRGKTELSEAELDQLRELSHHEDPAVRRRALHYLVMRGPDPGVAQAVALLEGMAEQVDTADLGDGQSVAEAMRIERMYSTRVALKALWLSTFKENAEPLPEPAFIERFVHDDDYDTRRMAVQVLQRMPAYRPSQAVLDMLAQDPDPTVQRAVAAWRAAAETRGDGPDDTEDETEE